MTATFPSPQRFRVSRGGMPQRRRTGAPPIDCIIHAERHTHDFKRVRHVTLLFAPDGRLRADCARTWARSIAFNRWGDINGEHKLRGASLPGPAWWFSCSGHGGYVLIARPATVPPWFARFAEDGSPCWTGADAYPQIAAYTFEEDCDWAVLLAAYPAAATAEARRTDRRIGPGGQPLWHSIIGSIRAWQPPEIVDALLMRPTLPAGPAIISTPSQLQIPL